MAGTALFFYARYKLGGAMRTSPPAAARFVKTVLHCKYAVGADVPIGPHALSFPFSETFFIPRCISK